MSNIFEITDKTGRIIYLSHDRWQHILDHKGMELYLDDIKKALLSPTLIVPHKYDVNKRNYYLYFKKKKRYLLVAVRYLNGKGYVSTAFITRKIMKR